MDDYDQINDKLGPILATLEGMSIGDADIAALIEDGAIPAIQNAMDLADGRKGDVEDPILNPALADAELAAVEQALAEPDKG